MRGLTLSSSSISDNFLSKARRSRFSASVMALRALLYNRRFKLIACKSRAYVGEFTTWKALSSWSLHLVRSSWVVRSRSRSLSFSTWLSSHNCIESIKKSRWLYQVPQTESFWHRLIDFTIPFINDCLFRYQGFIFNSIYLIGRSGLVGSEENQCCWLGMAAPAVKEEGSKREGNEREEENEENQREEQAKGKEQEKEREKGAGKGAGKGTGKGTGKGAGKRGWKGGWKRGWKRGGKRGRKGGGGGGKKREQGEEAQEEERGIRRVNKNGEGTHRGEQNELLLYKYQERCVCIYICFRNGYFFVIDFSVGVHGTRSEGGGGGGHWVRRDRRRRCRRRRANILVTNVTDGRAQRRWTRHLTRTAPAIRQRLKPKRQQQTFSLDSICFIFCWVVIIIIIISIIFVCLFVFSIISVGCLVIFFVLVVWWLLFLFFSFLIWLWFQIFFLIFFSFLFFSFFFLVSAFS